jgi:hypothetical protein
MHYALCRGIELEHEESEAEPTVAVTLPPSELTSQPQPPQAPIAPAKGLKFAHDVAAPTAEAEEIDVTEVGDESVEDLMSAMAALQGS